MGCAGGWSPVFSTSVTHQFCPRVPNRIWGPLDSEVGTDDIESSFPLLTGAMTLAASFSPVNVKKQELTICFLSLESHPFLLVQKPVRL